MLSKKQLVGLIAALVFSSVFVSGWWLDSPEVKIEQVSLGKRYINNKYKFEITVPSGWAITQGTGETVLSADGNMEGYSGVSLYVKVTPVPDQYRGADLDKFSEYERKNFREGFLEAYKRNNPRTLDYSIQDKYVYLGGKTAAHFGFANLSIGESIIDNDVFVVIKDGYFYQYILSSALIGKDLERRDKMMGNFMNPSPEYRAWKDRVERQMQAIADTFRFR